MVEPTDSPNREWRPDPSGRFELRRFFLGRPTSLVKRGTVISYDQVDPWLPAPPAQDAPTPPSSAPPPHNHSRGETAVARPESEPSAAPVPSATTEEESPPEENPPQDTLNRRLVSRLQIRRGLPVYLGAAALLIVIGGLVALILGLSSSAQPLTAPASTTTSANPAVELPSRSATGVSAPAPT